MWKKYFNVLDGSFFFLNFIRQLAVAVIFCEDSLIPFLITYAFFFLIGIKIFHCIVGQRFMFFNCNFLPVLCIVMLENICYKIYTDLIYDFIYPFYLHGCPFKHTFLVKLKTKKIVSLSTSYTRYFDAQLQSNMELYCSHFLNLMDWNFVKIKNICMCY